MQSIFLATAVIAILPPFLSFIRLNVFLSGLSLTRTADYAASVKSKTWTAQVNEVVCKIICHNICVVIQEMFDLNIEPDFSLS